MFRRFDTRFVIFAVVSAVALVWFALGLVETWRPGLRRLPFSHPVESVEAVPDAFHLGVTFLWSLILCLASYDDPMKNYRFADELRILLQGSGLAGLSSSTLIYLSDRGISRWSFVVFVGLAIGMLFTWRTVARMVLAALRRPPPTRRVLVVGIGPVAEHVTGRIDRYASLGLELVGCVYDEPEEPPESGSFLGRATGIRHVVEKRHVDEVIVVPPYSDSRLQEIVSALLDLPLHLRIVPMTFGLMPDSRVVEDIAGVPMIDLQASPLTDYDRVVKRIFEIVVASLLTVVALPLMGGIAMAIKCFDSPGPVLFRHLRVGENARLFVMCKFRTMVDNAEALQSQIVRRDDQGNLTHKVPDDPRVTWLGRFIRRTSLDELPQLFNVLKGDMSLVGPRPELPWLMSQHAPWLRRRLVVPQGLTGWW